MKPLCATDRRRVSVAVWYPAPLETYHVSIFPVFEEEEDPTSRSFFSEIISSISDVKFSHDGRYILSRDYLSLKIWDVNMESKPLKTIPIHDHLRGKLCDLYENDCIFDKFECTWGGDDKYVASSESSLPHLSYTCCVRVTPHVAGTNDQVAGTFSLDRTTTTSGYTTRTR